MGCSQTLISQIIAGRRSLTRVNLPAVSRVFDLTASEEKYLDDRLLAVAMREEAPPAAVPRKAPTPKNHLLAAWHHAYVKDLVGLKGFSPDVAVLQKMLTGFLSLDQIKRSRDFLLKEGFWRQSASGKLVPEENLVVTTHDIPNEKIQQFHRKALKIASDGIAKFPIGTRRKASTTLIAVNQKSAAELRGLIDEFHVRLQKFVEDQADGVPADELVQIVIHLTPCGVKYDKT